MKLEITKAQLFAICEIADNVDAMIGCSCGDIDKESTKQVRLIDRFLNKNGYARQFKPYQTK